MALDADRARRHRRPRLGDPPAPAGLGGQRAPGGLHRPDGRLPHLQAALPRRQARGRPLPPQALEAARRRARVRPHRRPRVQPHVRDARRPRPRHRLGRLPAPRDRAGHLHQLQERAPVRAQEAAVRDRPDRQVVSQRDHPRQLRLPHPRVRADGDGVLRARRTRRRSGSSTGPKQRFDWYVDLGIRAESPAPAPARRRRALPLLVGHLGHRVPVPDRLVGAGGDRQPRRLRPHASTPSSRARSSSTSTRARASATSRT